MDSNGDSQSEKERVNGEEDDEQVIDIWDMTKSKACTEHYDETVINILFTKYISCISYFVCYFFDSQM